MDTTSGSFWAVFLSDADNRRALLTEDILTRHGRKNTGVTNNVMSHGHGQQASIHPTKNLKQKQQR